MKSAIGQKQSNIAILGASRGLGFELAKKANEDSESLFLVSRKPIDLSSFSNPKSKIEELRADLTKQEGLTRTIEGLVNFRPTTIFYVAGGGPHGPFLKRQIKDHLWSMELMLLTPLKLLHWALNFQNLEFKQFIYIGSAVAENSIERGAGSYSAAKVGFKHMVREIQESDSQIDVRVFSPGYMNTDLLPKKAEPRLRGQKILEPKDVAESLLIWSQSIAYRNTNLQV